LEKNVSTGKVRPGILKTGTLPKKCENFSESMVADVTISCNGKVMSKKTKVMGGTNQNQGKP
jgi:hypothetical protein